MKSNTDNLTLSITTVGDLLLRQMLTCGASSDKGIKLTVPNYQRPYKWTARNVIQLLDDITEAKNSNKEKYRVGTLILHHNAENGGTYDIVDGLQRTISFSLLLKALGEDKIPFLEQRLYANEHNCHNIANNYQALYRRVGNKMKDTDAGREHEMEMKRLKDYVMERCELIVVITSDVSEAFQFFDSQNARGKALYPHDLLKAYHLREMNEVSEAETEKIVKEWESVPQQKLADFFADYLYRIKVWLKGERASILSEHNIHMFKGITRSARTPYAQFYKSAYCYADMVNSSAMPFVSGTRNVNAFQLNTPIIAGKRFFEYTKHYFRILKDIRDNSKYEGFYINDNIIVKTLDRYFKKGTGNQIARLLFDTSVLLYVDRFCPETYPTKEDMELFDQFVVFAFIWAYSLRAQYINLGWLSAQNYIIGGSDKLNAFNMYKLIDGQDTPGTLLSALADKLVPLADDDVRDGWARRCFECDGKSNKLEQLQTEGVYENYLYFFKISGFYNK